MKRQLGNELNYIEFEDVMTYGTKKDYDNRKKPNSFKVSKGEVGFEMSQLDFSKSAEFVIISGCLTKLVENGKVLFDRAGNLREKVAYEVVCNVIENGENLDKMVEEIIEKNFGTKEKPTQVVDEEKND